MTVRPAALLLALVLASQSGPALSPHTADIAIDTSSIDGRISPLLYGQFVRLKEPLSLLTAQSTLALVQPIDLAGHGSSFRAWGLGAVSAPCGRNR